MSKVRIRQDLFLGVPELDRLTNTFQGIGAANNIFYQMIERFGVVKKDSDLTFSTLQVTEGSTPSQITVNSGIAIDSNVDFIELKLDEVDVATIPTDSLDYYVILEYAQTSLEAGTVNISSDGTITGTGTVFTELLRGLPEFPVKLRFPNSLLNTSEYIVANVVDDLTCVLNGTTFTVENDLSFEVLGTFTPTVLVPDVEKNIYLLDSWSITISNSDVVTSGLQFILAKVKTDGLVMEISDSRLEYLFELINEQTINVFSAATAALEIVGFEFERLDNQYTPNDRGQVQIGWGLRSSTWTEDSTNNQLTITAGSGGLYKDLTPFTDDDFNGWRCYFKSGKFAKIVTSTISGGNITLTFESYDINLYGISGEIVVVPDADEVEFKITNTLQPNGDQITPIFSIAEGKGQVFPVVGTTSNIKFRLKTQGIHSVWTNIGNGQYYNASQFDSVGTLVGAPVYTISANGNITPNLDGINNFYLKKAWINRKQTFTAIQSFAEGTASVNTGGLIDISSEDGNTFAVSLSQYDVDYMTDEPIGTRVCLRFVPNASFEEVRFQPVSSPPAGYIEFHFPYISVLGGGLGYFKVDALGEVCIWVECQNIGGTKKWVVISTSKNPNIQEQIDLIEVDVAQNESNIATNLAELDNIKAAWTTYVPVVTTGSGAFNVTTSTCSYKRIGTDGKTVIVKISLVGTIVGSPPSIFVTYPVTGAVVDYLNFEIIQDSSNNEVITLQSLDATQLLMVKLIGGSFVAGAASFSGTFIYNLT